MPSYSHLFLQIKAHTRSKQKQLLWICHCVRVHIIFMGRREHRFANSFLDHKQGTADCAFLTSCAFFVSPLYTYELLKDLPRTTRGSDERKKERSNLCQLRHLVRVSAVQRTNKFPIAQSGARRKLFPSLPASNFFVCLWALGRVVSETICRRSSINFFAPTCDRLPCSRFLSGGIIPFSPGFIYTACYLL